MHSLAASNAGKRYRACRFLSAFRQIAPLNATYSTTAQPAEQQEAQSEYSTDSAAPGTYSPDIVHAFPREKSGTINSIKTRKLGRVPSVLLGLAGNQQRLLALPKNEINRYIREYRPSGVMSRLFYIKITEEDGSQSELIPALAKAIHKTAVNNELENVAWMYAPRGKVVDIEVPVRISGEDISPGIKKGGYVRYVRWSVSCKCIVPHIPDCIALDVSSLDLGKKVFLQDIEEELLSMGVRINEKHMGDPIIMISEAGSD